MTAADGRAWCAEQALRIARLLLTAPSVSLAKIPVAPQVLVHLPAAGGARLVTGPRNSATRALAVARLRPQLRTCLALLEAAVEVPPADDISFILDAARWAPTLDNRQTTRVSRTVPASSPLASSVPSALSDESTLLYVSLERSEVDGLMQRGDALVWMELAGFVENAREAAAARGLDLAYKLPADDEVEVEALLVISPTGTPAPPSFDVLPVATVAQACIDMELLGEVRRRHTDRRSFKTTPIPRNVVDGMTDLAASLDVTLDWHTSFSDRWVAGRALHRTYNTRSLQEDAGAQLNAATEWKRYSLTHMPIQALGAFRGYQPGVYFFCSNPRLWRSIARYGPPGTNSATTVDVGLMPGIRTGAHVTMSLADGTSWSRSSLFRGGVALQRIWLFTSASGLALHPTMAGVAFAWSSDSGTRMANEPHATASATALVRGLRRLWASVGTDSTRVVAMVRIGYARSPITARSLRLPLSHLTGETTD